MTFPLSRWLLAVLVVLCMTAAPAWPQNGDRTREALPQPLAGWQADLGRIEKSLARIRGDDGELVRLQSELNEVRGKAMSHADKLREQLRAVQSQLEKLGPAPKAEEPPESEAAAKIREELGAKKAELDGVIRTADVLRTRAAQLSDAVQERRRDLFSRQLFKRVRSPLMPTLWRDVARQSGFMLHSLELLLSDWWRAVGRPIWLILLVGAAVAVWSALKVFSAAVIERYRVFDEPGSPPFLHRAASATGVSAARALPSIAGAATLAFGMWVLDMLPGQTERLALPALSTFSLVMALIALIHTILAPNQPRWRVLPASDANANRLRWLACGVAVVYGLDLFTAVLNSVLVAPLPLTIARSFVTTVAVAVLLAAMLRVPVGGTAAGEAVPRSAWLGLLRFGLWVLVLAILAAAGLGYIALARFLIRQLVLTGSILVLVYLLHETIEEISASLSDPKRPGGRWLAEQLGVAPQRNVQVGLLASIVLHILLVVLVAPLLLLQWGFNWEDLLVWASKAMLGFQLGNWRISLAAILMAIVIFILGLIATRLFQRWLDARVLQRAQFEQGARSAIRTSVGYLGVAVAFLIAMSYTGLDFSHIAIVAGALSVGIGFGLQSIVNNFVSGLILLAERRISVGDWIVVGQEEGYVRRISVRATEIETFDRNFVIIPNAELITHTVKNWTFQHRRARIVIPIGVSYDSDPEQVREIVLACAMNHPKISDHAKTQVLFEDFGDSALLFRLKTFVSDVNDLLQTRSDLRFAIVKAFREAGIEIPYPQRDIHLRDIDRLEAAISGKPAPRRRRPAAKRNSPGGAK